MSQWKMDDSAANSVNWAVAQFNKTPNTANRDALYNNSTPSAFVTGMTVGQFAVDDTEVGITNGSIVSYTVTFSGSGYSANAAVTVSGNATSNATANATGRISAVNANTGGSGYTGSPVTVTVAAPAAQTFNSNTALYRDATFNSDTGVANTTEFITTASAHGFSNGDLVQYRTSTGNTALSGLTNASSYYIRYANTTAFKLSETADGANVNVTAAATGETGHTLRRVGQGYITLTGGALFANNDYVTYTVASGNTALTGLTSGSKYYVVKSNSTVMALSSTRGGSAIIVTPGVTETGHSITGEAATAVAVLSYTGHAVAHTGWNIRTVGSGGRAGRIQYETLVAGGITSDGEDTVFKDA